MFVYLSKKIAIPNNVRVRSVAWNTEQGWIACGGENGLLKVLKLDNSGGKGSNLSMNQTLEGHEKAISVVAWNDQYRKLTSSDEQGLIIVWMLHKGMWFEEMINNRNRSVVRDLAWNAEGQKVCIVYEDGAVIVGSVDGNRLWGKEMKKQLSRVTWSPDGRFLLFGTLQGEVNVHDSTTGQFLTKLFIQCVDDGDNKLAGLHWHTAFANSPDPVASLAICYECGKAQLMRNEGDEKPHLIDTGLNVTTMKWNPQGTVLAIGGMPVVRSDEKSVIVVQFFSNQGVHLRSLRIPGTSCGGVSWEGTGLRIALAIDSFIFFANVRPDYKWCYFNKTAVYAFSKAERSETCVMYWNVKSGEKNIKYVRRLTHIKAAGDACAIVSRVEDNAVQHMVQLTNSIGGPMETKHFDIEPLVFAMNGCFCVAASEEMVFFWQYRNPNVIVDVLDPVSIQNSRKDSKERLVHIDDLVTPDSVATTYTKKGLTNDLICAACCSEDYAFVSRESGLLHIYKLNPLTLVGKIALPNRAQNLHINMNSTKLGVVDLNGVLNIIKLDPETFSTITQQPEVLACERKDVWDMMWASDNPDMFATMEKTRMYVFRNLEPEEPVQSSAHLCKFKSLKIRSVVIDEMMQDPEKPSKDSVVDFETKSLRDTREILKSVSLKDAFQYVDDHPHPKLWSLLAEAALENLDFMVAEKAVVRCKEYPAIQFVKRIKALDDPEKQRAEVYAYYHRFDEAEQLYKEMDRKDLALELRARLGDWFRVVQLVQEGGGDEAIMVRAWDNIGDHYADRHKWTKAVQYYSQAKNYEKLAKVYYVIEDFRNLEKLTDQIGGHNKDLLKQLGEMFLSVGLAESAVKAYLKAGEVRMAVDACTELNQWDQAVALAEQHKLSDIGQYLTKYATHLVEKERVAQAIELYRKAGQHNEAASLLSNLAQRAAKQGEPLKAKKFYVLAALEIEKFRVKKMSLETKSATEVVDDLLVADKATAQDRSLDSAWRGAEAYHWYLLCQLHLFNNNVEAALTIAMRLQDYEDLIDPKEAGQLMALMSYFAQNFALCGKAFTRLEALEHGDAQTDMQGMLSIIEQTTDLDVTRKTTVATTTTVGNNAFGNTMGFGGGGGAAGAAKTANPYPTVNLHEKPGEFGRLAAQIFTRYKPEDRSIDRVFCPKCKTPNKDWASKCKNCEQPFHPCILTGRAITEKNFWRCHACHHYAMVSEMSRITHCPICHTVKQK